MTNESTKTTHIKAGMGKILDTGKYSNIEMLLGVSFAKVDFGKESFVNTYGISGEITTYNGFNKDKNGNLLNEGLYGNISTSTGINILGMLNNPVPVSNLEITSSLSANLGYKMNKLNTYINGSISGQIQNMSSTSNTGNGKIIEDGYSIGGGIDYDVGDGKISTNIDYNKYRGNNTSKVGVGYKNEDFKLSFQHEESNTDFEIVDNRSLNKIDLGLNIEKSGLEESFINISLSQDYINGEKIMIK